MSPVYLDWNATTPPHVDVVAAMRDALATAWANPASVHAPGRRARALVESARQAVAKLVRFDPRDVVLTSGGTEANNLALAHAFADGAGALVTSRLEHPSIVRVAEELAARGITVVWVDPDGDGALRASTLLDAVDRTPGVRLVAVQAVNHETGVIQPVADIARGLATRGVLLHVDAVQAVGRLDPSAWAGADLVSVAAHKIRGPKGIGALATRPGIALRPLHRGGAQERGLRPGTQDPAACAGFSVAATRAIETPRRYTELAALRDRFEATVGEVAARVGLAKPSRNGDAIRVPHVANLSFAGWRGDELAAALDLEGVAVSSGSACSAGTSEPSTVVTAMSGQARARSAIRISLGEDTTNAEIDVAIAAFARVLGRTPPAT